jgi:hypothetical protein
MENVEIRKFSDEMHAYDIHSIGWIERKSKVKSK